MKVLVTGSRGWRDEGLIHATLCWYKTLAEEVGEELIVIHGHCKSGADALADRVAKRMGMVAGEDLIRVPALWAAYGKRAGPIRNQRMLDDHRPDVVIAFRAAGKSNGTDDMIDRAKKADVKVHVVASPVNA